MLNLDLVEIVKTSQWLMYLAIRVIVPQIF